MRGLLWRASNLPLQEAAQEEMIGLWQGTFQLPQEYRESVGRSDRRP